MRIVRDLASLNLDHSKTVGFVPTMGAFHEGHLSLMRLARKSCDTLVVSLFVNPTQFGEGEDYSRYPRDEARDFSLAADEGVDVMFAPAIQEMYGDGASSTVRISGVTDRWEGAYRPGHFDGVATVVAKLFNIVRPDFAVFGEKDYQQCRVIDRMVRDLNFPVGLVFAPTVREPDGLALSSRNRYLSPANRAIAPKLHEELGRLAAILPALDWEPAIQEALDAAETRLAAAGFGVDYLELVDAETLEPSRDHNGPRRLIAAARLGTTRLIDNLAVPPG